MLHGEDVFRYSLIIHFPETYLYSPVWLWKPSDALFDEHALALFLPLSGDELVEKLYQKCSPAF